MGASGPLQGLPPEIVVRRQSSESITFKANLSARSIMTIVSIVTTIGTGLLWLGRTQFVVRERYEAEMKAAAVHEAEMNAELLHIRGSLGEIRQALEKLAGSP